MLLLVPFLYRSPEGDEKVSPGDSHAKVLGQDCLTWKSSQEACVAGREQH